MRTALARAVPLKRTGAFFATLCLGVLLCTVRSRAAEATTGAIVGTVVTENAQPIANARVDAVSLSGRYFAVSDAHGRFVILGIVPDTYVISVQAEGYRSAARRGVAVLAGATQRFEFALATELKTIETIHVTPAPFPVGATSDTFAVSAEAARALSPTESASGLAGYSAGTVQGAIARVPGVDQDAFANAILRGGKVDDAVFDYDSVPVPQGLIAEPGGNVVGAQLPTTGIATTTVSLAGYQAQGDNALGGIIDQIPAVGSYPGRTTIEAANGLGTRFEQFALQRLWATPDLRWRFAFAGTLGSEDFPYGDGHTFYPAEAGTYGLALQRRAQSSLSGNVHFQPHPSDDFSFNVLVGQASYDQYATPFAGETVGAFDGSRTVFPGETNPNAAVSYPSGVRGTYDIVKAQWVHTRPRSLSRLQVYQSQVGSQAGGPFWDDLSFPDGVISLAAHQGGREEGITYDVDDVASERHHVKYGAGYRINNTFVAQVVPTADEYISSNPTLFSFLAYLGDTWSMSRKLDVAGTARFSGTHIVPSNGFPYDVRRIDPHLSAVYRIAGDVALRVDYDHTTVAPKPLEADRTSSANPAPFVPLAPETANDFTYALEGGGRTQFRLTYYADFERNRIDVLPFNFRSAISAGQSPNGVGVPTNVGELVTHGLELWAKRGPLTMEANYIRGFSSSASQFAFNGLNAAAVAAGHLFPLGYVPDLSATFSYEIDAAHRRIRITPSLSYESGYPYGNGKAIWVIDPATGKPEQVPNDNYVNPGYNYYFLANPAQPYNAATNPYIASMGTPEGNDPNTLRTPPKALVSVHIEGDIAPRLTAMLDIVNLFGTTTPTQLQCNPYLIGPPGYSGGNAAYAAWYQQRSNGTQPYTLGNGVPTNDGVHPALPWAYGTGGYVPASYPLARTIQLRLRYQL